MEYRQITRPTPLPQYGTANGPFDRAVFLMGVPMLMGEMISFGNKTRVSKESKKISVFGRVCDTGSVFGGVHLATHICKGMYGKKMNAE